MDLADEVAAATRAAHAVAAAASGDGPRHRRTSILDLPNELLAAVLAHLDAQSALERRFRDDASHIIDGYYRDSLRGRDEYYLAHDRRPASRRHPLKAASLVCRRLRAAVLPLLFRHVLWTFARLEEPPAELYAAAARDGGGGLRRVADWFDLFKFLKRNGLAKTGGGSGGVDGLTLHVPCPEHLIDDPTELVGRYGLVPNTRTGPQ